MTETQIDIAEIKQTLKKIQEDIELLQRQQYEHKAAFYATLYPDVSTKPFDPNEVPDYVSVCKQHNDEYIGGPVAGYCPDYMKGDK